jgi:5-methylcytosine-specific restriction endonuclease McrA
VFKRDGYVCHLCGKNTHRVFSHHDPLSATVDHHPIPLSKGGDHDWHNVRCACKRCNELKGNKWDGQVRLKLQPT